MFSIRQPIDSVELNWTLSFKSSCLREEFFNFMRHSNTSNFTLLLFSIIHLFLFTPFNIYILIWKHDRDSGIFASLMILSSLMLSSLGILLYICGRYSDSSFAKQFYNYRPLLQAAYIAIAYGNCLLSFYHIRYLTHVCDELWVIPDWYCLGSGEDSSLFSLLRMVTLTPLILLIALHDTRVYLIITCNVIAVIVAMSIAFAKNDVNFVLQLVVWDVMVMIIFVDVHLLHVDKFLQHRKLQVAVEEIERMQTIDRETELRHMIGNVAHDLKTPLSSLTTAIEMIDHTLTEMEARTKQISMQEQLAPEEEIRIDSFVQGTNYIRSSLHDAHNTINFMFMTINRCIDYTKASKGIKLTAKYETVHLLQTLQIPLECMRNIQEKIQVIVNPISAEICSHITTDKQWLQENMLCLLSNAVKYSNDGVVSVSTNVKPFEVLQKELLMKKSTQNEKANGDDRMKPTRSTLPFLTRQNSSSSRYLPSSLLLRTFPKVIPTNSIDEALSSISHHNTTDFMITSSKTPSPNELFLCFEVEDSGIGLTDEMMMNLFAPFKQAQRLAGGTGLGLYSLAKRMDAIKGYYGAHKRSDDKHGSVFWFAIPYRPNTLVANFMHETSATEDPLEANRNNECNNSMIQKDDIWPSLESQKTISCFTKEALSATTLVAQNRKKQKILLVDDSPTIVRMMSMMLTRQGYEVIIAENGMIALEKIEQAEELEDPQNPSFDLIFMDMQMPVMDGIEATKRIRIFDQQQQQQQQRKESHHPLVVIGMSANSDEETKEAALLAGVNEFITKPVSMEMCSKLMTKYTNTSNK